MSVLAFFFFSFFLFVLGAVIGSFVNVIIYRSVIGESWIWGRSKCENCKKQLRWYDNIPVFSFLVLKGKCRFCKTSIAITHPVIEFLTGTLFVWWYFGGTLFFRLTQQPFLYIQPLLWLIVGLLVLIIFFADALYSIIPDEAVAILTILTFIYRMSLTLYGVMQPMDFVRTILGVALCSGFFWAVWFFSKGRGMGFGDVKFAVPFALLLGWPNVFVGMFLSFIFGATFAAVLLLLRKKKLKQTIPFGPFMVLGLIVTLLWGSALLRWYMGFL